MEKIINFLEGRKTFITAGVGALIVFARLANFINDEQFQILASLAGFTGLATLRLGMKQ